MKKIKFYKENNKRTRYLTLNEINRLLRDCSGHLRPIVIVALNTGMRLSELLNLKWQDIDLNQKLIYIIRSKNGDKREIPVNNLLFEMLKELGKTSKNSDYVFSQKDGSSFGRIHKGFKAACKRASKRKF